MEDIELKEMWNSYNQSIEEAKILNLQSWAVTIKTFEYLQIHKAKSKLSSLSAIKKRAVVVGMLWIFFLGLLVYGNQLQNLYFSVSLTMLIFFSIAAIAVYLKHIYMLNKINYSENLIDAQKKLTELQTSSINVFRVLWLQMPFYTTFFWSTKCFLLACLFGCTEIYR
jgi:cation transport ATPase